MDTIRLAKYPRPFETVVTSTYVAFIFALDVLSHLKHLLLIGFHAY
jgi:hypothetical protein